MNSREFFLLLSLTLLAPSCSSYQMTQQEIQRLYKAIEEHTQKKVHPSQVFPEDHEFPKYQDHFFYFLYHLEKKFNFNYYVDGNDLEDYFDQQDLESLIPLHKISSSTDCALIENEVIKQASIIIIFLMVIV